MPSMPAIHVSSGDVCEQIKDSSKGKKKKNTLMRAFKKAGVLAARSFSMDCVATITRITAQSLLDHYRRYAPIPLHEVFMGGGGSYNPNIIDYLRKEMPETRFATIDELGIPVGAKEALGFALYTCEGFVGRPLMVPRRVESEREGVIGHVQAGDNHFDLRRRVVRFWDDWNSDQVVATTKLVYER